MKEPLIYTHRDENYRPLFNVTEIPKENGSSIFVFTEHPDKPQDVPHVWDQAYEMGDSLIRAELEKDSAFKPESFSMYVERPERGADGEPRFAEYDAKTTKAENVSMVDNIYEYKASEWQWKDGNRMDKSELEERLDLSIKTEPLRSQDNYLDQQNEEWKSFSFATRDDQGDVGRRQQYQQEEAQKHQPQEAMTAQDPNIEQEIER